MKPTTDSDWKLVEEIAALLEKALTPDAMVEHNVRLPVLGTRRRRQCDVVIRYGEPPRQTITIVEVQKRQRRPDINTFHGWVRKMGEVGAQHLICVSALGYPKSIVEDVATRIGPTVKLLTLEELREGIPNLVFFEYKHRQPFVTVMQAGPIRLAAAEEGKRLQRLSTNDKVFELGPTGERVSLNDLAVKKLDADRNTKYEQGDLDPDVYERDFVFGLEDELAVYLNGGRFTVRSLPLKVKVVHEVTDVPLIFYAYKQEEIDGALAWVASGRGVFHGDEISMQVVFKPNVDGLLLPVLIRQQGAALGLLEVYRFQTAP